MPPLDRKREVTIKLRALLRRQLLMDRKRHAAGKRPGGGAGEWIFRGDEHLHTAVIASGMNKFNEVPACPMPVRHHPEVDFNLRPARAMWKDRTRSRSHGNLTSPVPQSR